MTRPFVRPAPKPAPTAEEELLARIEELSFLRALNDRLARVPDFASACRALVDMVWEERQVDSAAYVSVDWQRRICRLEASAPAHGETTAEFGFDTPPFSDLVERAEPVVLFDPPPLPWVGPLPERSEGTALVCAPTQVRDVTSGLLLVHAPRNPNILEESRRLLAIVATSAALALDVARNQSREEFLAMLRHDINNPVNVAIGYTEMIIDRLQERRAGGDDELLQIATSVTQSLKAIADLVSNYLHMTAIDRGTPWLHLETVDVSALLRDVVEQLRPSAAEKDISVRLHGTAPSVQADRRQLGRVAVNLLGNAIKYTADGGHVEVEVAADGESAAQLRVTDSGYGLSEGDLERVFSKYARFHRHLGIPGTGLGLYLSKAIVEAHGGTISVTSAPGRGSTFVVRLPCRR